MKVKSYRINFDLDDIMEYGECNLYCPCCDARGKRYAHLSLPEAFSKKSPLYKDRYRVYMLCEMCDFVFATKEKIMNIVDLLGHGAIDMDDIKIKVFVDRLNNIAFDKIDFGNNKLRLPWRFATNLNGTDIYDCVDQVVLGESFEVVMLNNDDMKKALVKLVNQSVNKKGKTV